MGPLLKPVLCVIGLGALHLVANSTILQLDSNVHAGLNDSSQYYSATSYADLAGQHSLPNNLVYGVGSSCLAALEYDFGQLHARVMASRTQGGNGAYGAGELILTDLYTVTSSSAAIGTPVDITFYMAVHATFGHPVNWSENGYDDVVYKFGDLFSTTLSGEMRNTGNDLLSFQVHTAVGVSGYLYANLLVSAASPGDPGGSVDVNAFNTANIYVGSSRPDVDVTSASGLVYGTSPVPEPSSMALGVLGLAAAARRRALTA